MPWTLAGVTIHPDDSEDAVTYEALYAIQQVLDAIEETIAFYGASSERRSLSFILDEDETSGSGKTALVTAKNTDANVTLVSDQGTEGTYRILRLGLVRLQALNHTNPVYKGQVELIAT